MHCLAPEATGQALSSTPAPGPAAQWVRAQRAGVPGEHAGWRVTDRVQGQVCVVKTVLKRNLTFSTGRIDRRGDLGFNYRVNNTGAVWTVWRIKQMAFILWTAVMFRRDDAATASEDAGGLYNHPPANYRRPYTGLASHNTNPLLERGRANAWRPLWSVVAEVWRCGRETKLRAHSHKPVRLVCAQWDPHLLSNNTMTLNRHIYSTYTRRVMDELHLMPPLSPHVSHELDWRVEEKPPRCH